MVSPVKERLQRHSRPHLEKVVPCPPASESPSPHSATGKRGEERKSKGVMRTETERQRQSQDLQRYIVLSETHTEHILPELLGFDAGEHSQK